MERADFGADNSSGLLAAGDALDGLNDTAAVFGEESRRPPMVAVDGGR